MEAGDIVDIGEGAVVAGRSLGSGRMTGNSEVIPKAWKATPVRNAPPTAAQASFRDGQNETHIKLEFAATRHSRQTYASG